LQREDLERNTPRVIKLTDGRFSAASLRDIAEPEPYRYRTAGKPKAHFPGFGAGNFAAAVYNVKQLGPRYGTCKHAIADGKHSSCRIASTILYISSNRTRDLLQKPHGTKLIKIVHICYGSRPD